MKKLEFIFMLIAMLSVITGGIWFIYSEASGSKNAKQAQINVGSVVDIQLYSVGRYGDIHSTIKSITGEIFDVSCGFNYVIKGNPIIITKGYVDRYINRMIYYHLCIKDECCRINESMFDLITKNKVKCVEYKCQCLDDEYCRVIGQEGE